MMIVRGEIFRFFVKYDKSVQLKEFFDELSCEMIRNRNNMFVCLAFYEHSKWCDPYTHLLCCTDGLRVFHIRVTRTPTCEIINGVCHVDRESAWGVFA